MNERVAGTGERRTIEKDRQLEEVEKEETSPVPFTQFKCNKGKEVLHYSYYGVQCCL